MRSWLQGFFGLVRSAGAPLLSFWPRGSSSAVPAVSRFGLRMTAAVSVEPTPATHCSSLGLRNERTCVWLSRSTAPFGRSSDQTYRPEKYCLRDSSIDCDAANPPPPPASSSLGCQRAQTGCAPSASSSGFNTTVTLRTAKLQHSVAFQKNGENRSDQSEVCQARHGWQSIAAPLSLPLY